MKEARELLSGFFILTRHVGLETTSQQAPERLLQRTLVLLSPVENGGVSRWKMAARGIEGLNGVAPGEPGIGIGWGRQAA